eukprot:1135577-Pyramimonas_sp.AAC.1
MITCITSKKDYFSPGVYRDPQDHDPAGGGRKIIRIWTSSNGGCWPPVGDDYWSVWPPKYPDAAHAQCENKAAGRGAPTPAVKQTCGLVFTCGQDPGRKKEEVKGSSSNPKEAATSPPNYPTSKKESGESHVGDVQDRGPGALWVYEGIQQVGCTSGDPPL